MRKEILILPMSDLCGHPPSKQAHPFGCCRGMGTVGDGGPGGREGVFGVMSGLSSSTMQDCGTKPGTQPQLGKVMSDTAMVLVTLSCGY